MGQFDSDLLGPSEVETWDTLMGAQDPNWNQPAPAPAYEPAADQMYAPAPELSYAAPYEAPAQNYGTDASAYAPEMAYGGPAEPAYVDPFMAGDATQQYQDPFMQQAYAPAPYVDNSGAIPPGSLDPWESPSNFSENEAFSTISGEDIGGRSTPGTAPASAPGFFESRNPQFAQSNAQFDATTNPENRGGPGILGGAANLANTYGADIPGWSDLARETIIPGLAGSLNAQNPLTWFDNPVGNLIEKGNRLGAESFVPVSLGDVALTALPGIGLFDNAGQTALRGYGQNLDTFRKAAGQIDELPLGAAYAALDNPLQNPALAPDVTDLMVGNRPRSIAGAADDGSSRLDDAIEAYRRIVAEDDQILARALDDPNDVDWVPSFRRDADHHKAELAKLEEAKLRGGVLSDYQGGLPPKQQARVDALAAKANAEYQASLGVADDVGDTPFAAAKKTLQDQFAGMNKGEIRATLEGAGFSDEIVTNKNGVLNTDKTYDAVARKVAGEGPTPRVAPAADVAPVQIAETADDALKAAPAPGEKFPTGTVRSAANDPVDFAEAEFAKTHGRSPSNEAANYVSDAPLSGQQAGLPLDGVKAADTRGFWAKFVDEAAASASLPRSILASFDLSAPGRQGLALAFRHPKEWVESWAPMLKAWRTEGGAEAMARELGSINARIKSMVGTQDDMIHLYEVGADAKGLNKVPGFEGIGKGKISGAIGKVDDALGNPLGRSERAYATFLNYQKSKTFETMATAMHKAGERNLDAYKRLGEVIDHATGFGAAPLTGRLEGQAFFSQRYMTSRFQFLTDPIVEALIKRDMKAAQAATENLVAFTGGLGGILALIDATGVANVEWDPRSTDFGKIRIGPQRIDFGAGFLPLVRTLSREVTGEAKASTGGVYDTSRIKEPLKFLRNKLAPIPSEVISRILGEDPVGNPNAPILSFTTLANMFAPLIAQSTVEAFKQTGSPAMAGRAAVSELFGGGTGTYGTGQAQQIDYAQNVYGKEYDSLASTQQASLNAYIVEQGADLPYRNRQAPWWQARDDALTDWAASIDPETLADPFSQKALSIKDSGYVDLQPELVKWAEDTYKLPRDEAEAAVEKFLTSTGLDDQVKKYREYVLEQDPGFAKSWLDAYNGYEKDVYEPPKWIKDIAKGK